MNVAVGRPSRQSSTETITDWDVGPDRANDGNVNGNMNVGQSCSHTVESDYPWWAVDLGSVRLVLSVHIYNRVDCKLDSNGYSPFILTYRQIYKHDYTINTFLSFILSYCRIVLAYLYQNVITNLLYIFLFIFAAVMIAHISVLLMHLLLTPTVSIFDLIVFIHYHVI